jgi:predicted metal-binding membrane protein
MQERQGLPTLSLPPVAPASGSGPGGVTHSGLSGVPWSRDRVIVLMGLVAVSVAAWGYMLHDYVRMQSLPMSQMWMPPTGGAPWSLQDFWLTFVMWAVMMVAMMVPSAAPMVLMFATVNRKRRSQQRPYVPTFVFVSGYVAVWTLFSAVVTLAQWPLHHWALLTPMMDNASATMAGLVLLAAGVYQWTPWKDACLHQCRTPLGFLMTEWREGAGGAFLMGVKHGFFCVGCCWALMLVLFAVGVMNILWVAIITLFVLAEKVFPWRPTIVRGVSGLLLVASGILVLAG